MKPGWAFPTENPIAFGYNHETLVQAVVNYRLANDIPLGDVEADVANDLCARQSFLCREEAVNMDETLELDKANARTPLERVRLASKLFAHNRGTGWKELETKEAAEKRAAICENCPQNCPFAELSSCSPCHDELTRQSTMISQGQRTSKNPGWCSAVLMDLRSGVFLPKEALERQLKRAEVTPSFCWLRDLNES